MKRIISDIHTVTQYRKMTGNKQKTFEKIRCFKGVGNKLGCMHSEV
jgi:hypothetical protein